ncbi:MAG: hypothetical protein JNL57_08855 [Bacteroidetes bacterium]|nr:hypothetical protein [Bacteroidota bacterium]
MALATLGVQYSGKTEVPWHTYMGLVLLLVLMLLVHYYIYGVKNDGPNSQIRRLMTGSMLRLAGGVAFLAISLFNFKPVSLPFVVFYCLYFALYLLFEISDIRTNLRPESKQASKNENA